MHSKAPNANSRLCSDDILSKFSIHLQVQIAQPSLKCDFERKRLLPTLPQIIFTTYRESYWREPVLLASSTLATVELLLYAEEYSRC